MFKRLFSTRGGSYVRSLLRVALICATAFGLQWTPEQIATVQLVAEALLHLVGYLVVGDELPPPPAPPA